MSRQSCKPVSLFSFGRAKKKRAIQEADEEPQQQQHEAITTTATTTGRSRAHSLHRTEADIRSLRQQPQQPQQPQQQQSEVSQSEAERSSSTVTSQPYSRAGSAKA